MLEVCVDSVQAAVAAVEAGATRLELCAALDVGGVTPCRAFVEAVRAHVSCPLIVLVRPRSGNFVYDRADAEQIRQTILQSLDLDVQGFAVGACNAQGQLDQDLLASLVSLKRSGIEWVMHRAFDFTCEPAAALEQLIALGFQRVLTSGGANGNALANIDRLHALVQQAAGRITILPGGGITAQNAAAITCGSGCSQLHGSFRLPIDQSDESNQLFGSHRMVDREAIHQVARLVQSTG